MVGARSTASPYSLLGLKTLKDGQQRGLGGLECQPSELMELLTGYMEKHADVAKRAARDHLRGYALERHSFAVLHTMKMRGCTTCTRW